MNKFLNKTEELIRKIISCRILHRPKEKIN